MGLQAIIVSNVVAILLAIVLYVNSTLAKSADELIDTLFPIMTVLCGAGALGEMLSFIADGRLFTGAYALNWIGNMWIYLCNMLLGYIWCVYVEYRLFGSRRRLKKYYGFLAIPLVVGVVVLISNIWTQKVFSVSAANVYARESMSNLLFFIVFVYMFYSLLLYCHYRYTNSRYLFFPIWLYLLPVGAGCIAQLIFYGISVAWCSVSIALVAVYLATQNEMTYLDSWTFLYNRKYLQLMLRRIARRKNIRYGGIMLDMDYFKQINDTYGHTVGDEALQTVAGILRDISSEANAIVTRFAGDEFVILVRIQDEEDVRDLMRRLDETFEGFNASGQREYQLSFSMGYSVFHSGESAEDRFLKEMDMAMYRNKRKTHAKKEEA